MDPSYQQAMIQALMGAQTAAPGAAQQTPSTPWGAGFMTGNMMLPPWMGAQQQQPGGAGTVNPQQLQQSYATYPGTAQATSPAVSGN